MYITSSISKSSGEEHIQDDTGGSLIRSTDNSMSPQKSVGELFLPSPYLSESLSPRKSTMIGDSLRATKTNVIGVAKIDFFLFKFE